MSAWQKQRRVFLCYSRAVCHEDRLHGEVVRTIKGRLAQRGIEVWAYEDYLERFPELRYEPAEVQDMHSSVLRAIALSDCMLYLSIDGNLLFRFGRNDMGEGLKPGARHCVLSLDRGQVPSELRDRFRKNDVVLPESTAVFVKTSSREWQLRAGTLKYAVLNDGVRMCVYVGDDTDKDTLYMGCEHAARDYLDFYQGEKDGGVPLCPVPGIPDEENRLRPPECPRICYCVRNAHEPPRPKWVDGKPEVLSNSVGSHIAYPRREADLAVWFARLLPLL